MLKNIQKSVCALAVLAATATPALAAGIDLKVIGTITPAACTPVISGAGTVDYGIIPAESLAQNAYTVLGEKISDLTITCSAPTKVVLHAINGRPGTLAGASETAQASGVPPVTLYSTEGAVGLGADGGVNVGGYALKLSSIMLDGSAAKSQVSQLATAGTWSPNNLNAFYRTDFTTYTSFVSAAAPTNEPPTAFTTMSAQIRTKAYINKASALDLSKPIQLDGLTTFEMTYL